MKDRILAFLQNENKSYAQFAEEIGVQPSGISHILSGRNNPSLDFVIKMLQKYSSLSAEWLLFGRGPMYRLVSQPTLFDIEIPVSGPEPRSAETDSADWRGSDIASEARVTASDAFAMAGRTDLNPDKRIVMVLFFYDDKTFSEYRPT